MEKDKYFCNIKKTLNEMKFLKNIELLHLKASEIDLPSFYQDKYLNKKLKLSNNEFFIGKPLGKDWLEIIHTKYFYSSETV